MSTPSSTISTASGVPSYSDSFIPQIWAGKLLVKFYKTTVFAAISNTDYEGQIKAKGDTVFIRTTPDTTIRDYVEGAPMQLEFPKGSKIEMNIDKAKYFYFGIDDIAAHQSDIAMMNDWSSDAGEQMQITIDSGILNDIYSDVDSDNSGATAGAESGSYDMGASTASEEITKTNVLDYFVDVGSVLYEQNIPRDNRWGVIPEWMSGLILKSDLKNVSITGDGKSSLRNGRIGEINNFTLYTTNQYTAVTDTDQCYHVLFGHKSALTFASQMTKMETLRHPDFFGDVIRGLNVYGYKVVHGDAMVDLYCHKG